LLKNILKKQKPPLIFYSKRVRLQEETKTTTYFLFETSKVTKEDDLWLVKCEVKNIFEEQTKKYTMIIDEDGTIMDVRMYD